MSALIFGVGPGLGAALARACAGAGMAVAVAARSREKLAAIAQETGALALECDVGDAGSVARAFAAAERLGPPEFVAFNASARLRGPVAELDLAAVERVLRTGALGGFHVGQCAARAMLAQGRGTIALTGATASVKGFALSGAFAMAKFGLRGLAQSMARELAPKGIHVIHAVIDGRIGRSADDSTLDPDAIAATYLALHRQPRSAWTWEVELRPWVESF